MNTCYASFLAFASVALNAKGLLWFCWGNGGGWWTNRTCPGGCKPSQTDADTASCPSVSSIGPGSQGAAHCTTDGKPYIASAAAAGAPSAASAALRTCSRSCGRYH